MSDLDKCPCCKQLMVVAPRKVICWQCYAEILNHFKKQVVEGFGDAHVHYARLSYNWPDADHVQEALKVYNAHYDRLNFQETVGK